MSKPNSSEVLARRWHTAGWGWVEQFAPNPKVVKEPLPSAMPLRDIHLQDPSNTGQCCGADPRQPLTPAPSFLTYPCPPGTLVGNIFNNLELCPGA